MKIAFFNTARVWGGGEKWHFEVSEALRGRGWETVVFTSPQSELYNRLSDSGQKLYCIRITNRSFLNLSKIKKIRDWFIKEKIDAVIINSPSDLKVAGAAAKLAGVKRIIYRRGSAIPVRNTFLNRFIFGKIVTDILANSLETKKTILLKNANLFPSEKIKVIYNGLDLSKYEEVDCEEARGGVDEPIVIGNLGRMVKQKGQHYLIDLAIELKKRGVGSKVIIGGDGSLREQLSDLAIKGNVSDSISFPGFVNDVPKFIRSIDCFVLTSLWEGFGYVIAEAFLYGKPVVAFDISSNGELIKNGENGFLVKMGDVEEMARKIEYLNKNREKMREMGIRGREFVRENLTIEKTVEKIEEFLKTSGQ